MIFNSRDTRFKTPFGAISTKREFTVNFPLPEDVRVKEGFLVVKNGEYKCHPLTLTKNEDGFNFYSITLNFSEAGVYWYNFKFITDKGAIYFGADEFKNAVETNDVRDWQLTVYRDDYVTPDFIKGGMIYHIFADRFNRAGVNKTERKYRLHDNWNEDPEIVAPDGKYRADDFFGGNINGIIEKLDYIKSLGATAIYLSPIFEAQSNHRYDTGDFFKIDPLFGNETQFEKLVKEADKRGLSIIFDGVFNHTGADSIYFNKFGTYPNVGAFQSKSSPYYNWYTFQKFPNKYTSWWGCTNVPTVVHGNPEYQKLIFDKGGVVDKWTSLGVKGWRLDVVDELPVDFVTKLRKTIKSVNSDTVIIGEVWEDASIKVSYHIQRPYLNGYQLDGVMNYPFRTAIIDFVTKGDINKFKCDIWTILENYPRESLDCSMNIIGTHDTVRAINQFSNANMCNTTKQQRLDKKLSAEEYEFAKKRLKLAALLQFTLPGVPTVFYGDEAGLEGYEDPINRRTYPWGKEDNELINFYKLLGKIRSENRDLFVGSFKILDYYDMLAYRLNNGNKELFVLVNPNDKWVEFKIPEKSRNLLNNTVAERGSFWLPPKEYAVFITE